MSQENRQLYRDQLRRRQQTAKNMETYQGIKFCTRRERETFTTTGPLEELNRWVHILAELGLAPVHRQGAFGNHSFREDDGSFVITRTGMMPRKDLRRDNYCRVRYDAGEDLFVVHGRHDPSSECFLHHLLYLHFPSIRVIMHGHSGLLNSCAESLGIPLTSKEYPYGTRELAEGAVDMAAHGASFFILRNHGFVAADRSVGTTVSTILDCYHQLLDRLREDDSAGR